MSLFLLHSEECKRSAYFLMIEDGGSAIVPGTMARSRQSLHSKLWRRGWAVKVALATSAPTEGASPLVSPHAGELLPREPPRSTPTKNACRGATPFPVISCHDLSVLWRATARWLMIGRLLARQGWRRGWESNPRSSYPDTGFRDRHFRPLSHLSALSAVKRYS